MEELPAKMDSVYHVFNLPKYYLLYKIFGRLLNFLIVYYSYSIKH